MKKKEERLTIIDDMDIKIMSVFDRNIIVYLLADKLCSGRNSFDKEMNAVFTKMRDMIITAVLVANEKDKIGKEKGKIEESASEVFDVIGNSMEDDSKEFVNDFIKRVDSVVSIYKSMVKEAKDDMCDMRAKKKSKKSMLSALMGKR